MRQLLGVVVSALAIGCSPAGPARFSEADKTAIRAAEDSFVAYGRSRRDSATAALYTENAILMPPNQGAVEGRAAIRAWLEHFPAMSEFTLSPIEIDGNGDLAYVRGTYALTIAAASGKPATPDHGKYVVIRRRQPDGKWLIAVDIFNSDGQVK